MTSYRLAMLRCRSCIDAGAAQITNPNFDVVFFGWETQCGGSRSFYLFRARVKHKAHLREFKILFFHAADISLWEVSNRKARPWLPPPLPKERRRTRGNTLSPNPQSSLPTLAGGGLNLCLRIAGQNRPKRLDWKLYHHKMDTTQGGHGMIKM